MSTKVRLLFVDDEVDFLEYMTKRLELRGIEVTAFSDPEEALAEADERLFDVALVDLKMPGVTGDKLLHMLKERDPFIEVIIITGHGSIQTAFDTSRSGAYEYVLKPCKFDELATAISNAYAKRIKAEETLKAKQVDSLLQRNTGASPWVLLNELNRIKDK